MPLTALQVKNAKPGRHADGKGLYLLVKPSGARSWVLRVVVKGRRRDFGLGPVDLVSLQAARDKAVEGRKIVRAGFDPAQEWKRSTLVIPSFETVARKYHENVKQGWKNGKHGAQWLSTLEAHAFPEIGRLAVNEVDVAAIQRVLLPIWLTVPETARRVRQRIGAVLDYAHGQGWRASDAPMRAVGKGLPQQPRKRGHFAAMPYADVPTFVSRLRAMEVSIGRLALEFTILTAARSGEVRGAKWDEIDLEARTWTVPAVRMKAGEEHVVPLTGATLKVLRDAQAFHNGEPDAIVFPGVRGGPLSDMTLAKALKTSGGTDCTVHGFRSSFRDWVAEQTSFPGDWAEAALAHTLPNRVEAAYRRTRFVEQRVAMMEAWDRFLDDESVPKIRLIR